MTEIVVNHVTRMKAPQICVAGLKTHGSGHIRPVTGRSNPLTRSLLPAEGGIFGLGAKVELGTLTPRPSPPEVEDQLFWPDRARLVDVLASDDYLSLVDEACEEDLGSIFGPSLVRYGWGMSVPEGEGTASLGCLRVAAALRPKLTVDYGKVTLQLSDPDKPFYFSVTDVRLYEADQRTPKSEAAKSVQQRLDRGVPLRLMVGLSRAWALNEGDELRHRLQVNGLCLEDTPLGATP